MDFSTITIAGQKGGVGKSALARLIAVEYARVGQDTLLADLDPAQATSSEWAARRTIDPAVDVLKVRTVGAAQRRMSAGGLLVFDCPPYFNTVTLSAARAADYVVIPTGISEDDLRAQLTASYTLLDAGIDQEQIVFALTRVKGSERDISDAQRYLSVSGCKVCPTPLRELPIIRQAMNAGKAASETGRPHIDNEALTLWTQIANGLVDRLTE